MLVAHRIAGGRIKMNSFPMLPCYTPQEPEFVRGWEHSGLGWRAMWLSC